MKTYSLSDVKHEVLGKKGTLDRDNFKLDQRIAKIGFAFREKRLEQGLTQDQFGQLAGVSRSQISRFENHAGDVTLTTLFKIIGALKAKATLQIVLSDKTIEIEF